MFVVVSYDIVEDKTRNKVANILKDYGKRVQYSVFECIITEELLKRMVNRVQKVINLEEDSFRVYRLCKDCKNRIDVYGKGTVTEDKEVYIV